MRLKQVIGICALFTSSIHANAIDDQLRNFIGDDASKLDSVLATTPSFNELDKTYDFTEAKQTSDLGDIPTTEYDDPFDITVDNWDSPILADEDDFLIDGGLEDDFFIDEGFEDDYYYIDDSENSSDLILQDDTSFDDPIIDEEFINEDVFFEDDSTYEDDTFFQEDFFIEEESFETEEDIFLFEEESVNNDTFIEESDDVVSTILEIEPEFTESENIESKEDEEVATLETFDYILGADDVISEETETFETIQVEENDVEESFVQIDEDISFSTETTNNDWIDNAEDQGNGWYHVDWFGYIFAPDGLSNIANGTWIFHTELMWLHITSDSFDSVWIWSNSLNQWIWTSKDSFPYASVQSDNGTFTWLYFDLERGLLYDYEQQKYFDLN